MRRNLDLSYNQKELPVTDEDVYRMGGSVFGKSVLTESVLYSEEGDLDSSILIGMTPPGI